MVGTARTKAYADACRFGRETAHLFPQHSLPHYMRATDAIWRLRTSSGGTAVNDPVWAAVDAHGRAVFLWSPRTGFRWVSPAFRAASRRYVGHSWPTKFGLALQVTCNHAVATTAAVASAAAVTPSAPAAPEAPSTHSPARAART
jgi:hypothetical protein